MKKVSLVGMGINLFIFLFILIIGETFDFNFITSALMISISVFFLFLFLIFLCVFWMISVKKISSKILPIIFFCFFLLTSLISLNHTFKLYKDKEAYEKEAFVIIEGKPDEVSFNKDNYLNKLIINGVELDVTMLDMTKGDFEQNFHNREMIVKYLPKSKLIVKMDIIEQ